MSILSFIGLFVGSVISLRWNRAAGNTRMPQGTPPTDYTQMTQPELLDQFSDAIGPNGITPRALRNFVASTATITPGGVPPSIPLPVPGWTTATRPDGASLVGPAIGYNYDLRQLDMWDDRAGLWVNPSFQGGTIAGQVTFAGGLAVTGGNAVFSSGLYANGQTFVITNLPTSDLGQTAGQFLNNGQTVAIAR